MLDLSFFVSPCSRKYQVKRSNSFRSCARYLLYCSLVSFCSSSNDVSVAFLHASVYSKSQFHLITGFVLSLSLSLTHTRDWDFGRMCMCVCMCVDCSFGKVCIWVSEGITVGKFDLVVWSLLGAGCDSWCCGRLRSRQNLWAAGQIRYVPMHMDLETA